MARNSGRHAGTLSSALVIDDQERSSSRIGGLERHGGESGVQAGIDAKAQVSFFLSTGLRGAIGEKL